MENKYFINGYRFFRHLWIYTALAFLVCVWYKGMLLQKKTITQTHVPNKNTEALDCETKMRSKKCMHTEAYEKLLSLHAPRDTLSKKCRVAVCDRSSGFLAGAKCNAAFLRCDSSGATPVAPWVLLFYPCGSPERFGGQAQSGHPSERTRPVRVRGAGRRRGGGADLPATSPDPGRRTAVRAAAACASELGRLT